MSENMKDKGVQPVIEAQIGDTWDQVIQHSTFKLGPLPTPAGTIINQPHTFSYRDPRHRMRFDNVGYVNVFIGYENTAIRSFGIGPYRESAGVDETWRRLQDIIRKMEQARWIPDDHRNRRNPSTKSAEDLRSLYVNLGGGAAGDEKYWFDEYGNEASVRLVKTITDRETGEEPRFNVVLQIQVATHPKQLKTTH